MHVTIGKTDMNIPFVRTFSDVPLKKPLLYIDSRGHLALAVNQGSFAATYSIKPPVAIFFLARRKTKYCDRSRSECARAKLRLSGFSTASNTSSREAG